MVFWSKRLIALGAIYFVFPALAVADGSKLYPPKTAVSALSFFTTDKKTNQLFLNDYSGEVIDVTDDFEEVSDEQQAEKVTLSPQTSNLVLNQINSEYTRRIDPNAPDEFKGMVGAFRQGDIAGANQWADHYVQYMANLMYEVKELTKIVGAALVRNGMIEEEGWDGVEQYLDFEFAQASESSPMGALMKTTHDKAMKRIVPDKNNEAEIYYFFTLNCRYCRMMAPDVERLWQTIKDDDKVKMVALTLGPQPENWIESYREYTGLTAHIRDGSHVAKAFNIAFTPALVVVAPDGKRAYVKTGQQSFERMYEFVRTVQGLPATITPEVQKLVQRPIGSVELANAKGEKFIVMNSSEREKQTENRHVEDGQSLNKF